MKIINVKKSQHGLKQIRRFQEDIWGRLATFKKPSSVLNFIYQVYMNDRRYRKLLRKRRFYFFYKKTKIKTKFTYKPETDEKEFKRRKKTIKSAVYLMLLKLRRFYGYLGKKKLKRVLLKKGLNTNVLTESFAYLLESRLDVILYRSNFFSSIFAARQYINHKKVFVNGSLVTKPGTQIMINDIVTITRTTFYYKELKNRLSARKILVNFPRYLEVNYKLGSIILTKKPKHNEVPYPCFLNIKNISHSFLR